MIESVGRAARLDRHDTVATRLTLLSDRQLAARLADAAPVGAGIGGATARLDVDGTPVFVKQVPLTELELRPEHVRSTANMFELPTFYQYGIGSAGFGAWRELAAHILTTNWVLENRCHGFPLLYHWRILPRTPAEPAPGKRAERVAYWEGSPAVAARLEALESASASLVLFMEYFPQTVGAWLQSRIEAGTAAPAYARLERALRAGTDFMNARGLLHFDAHFGNVLTDGRRFYFADFGLAMHAGFDYSPAEAAFFQAHQSYDRHYTPTHFARWLLYKVAGATPEQCDDILHATAAGRPVELPAAAARIVARHAPVAAVMSDFYLGLIRGTKNTPYPGAALDRTGVRILV